MSTKHIRFLDSYCSEANGCLNKRCCIRQIQIDKKNQFNSDFTWNSIDGWSFDEPVLKIKASVPMGISIKCESYIGSEEILTYEI